ncbi:MAG: SdpI family protein, partial [Candidatus Diapherotrites archaeon]
FLLYLHALTILAGLGMQIEIKLMLLPALSVLFFYIALLLRKSKRNWFVGIRTPWTMSSDFVWEKTHKIGSYCFALMAVFIFILAFVQSSMAFIALIAGVLVFSIVPVIYSYQAWREEQGRKHKKPLWK